MDIVYAGTYSDDERINVSMCTHIRRILIQQVSAAKVYNILPVAITYSTVGTTDIHRRDSFGVISCPSRRAQSTRIITPNDLSF